MTNRDFCDYVRSLDDEGYFADTHTCNEWGQNCGGYLKSTNGPMKEKAHFLSYYDHSEKEKITYAYLRCPQLIVFIAEIMGVPRELLESAVCIVMKYEEENKTNLQGGKNGNYIWGHKEFTEFKQKLHYSDVIRYIKASSNVEEAKKSIQGSIENEHPEAYK